MYCASGGKPQKRTLIQRDREGTGRTWRGDDPGASDEGLEVRGYYFRVVGVLGLRTKKQGFKQGRE